MSRRKTSPRSIVFQKTSGGETGVEQIERLVESTPDWAKPIITIKFSRRKLVVFDARELLSALGECDYHVGDTVSMLQPRDTKTDNISLVMPTLDNWKSASASLRDSVVLAQTLGLPLKEEHQ